MHNLDALNGYGSVESYWPICNHGAEKETSASSKTTEATEASQLQEYCIPLNRSSYEPSLIATVKRGVRKSSNVMLHSLGFYNNPVLASSSASIASVTDYSSSSTSHNQESIGNSPKKRNSSYADMRLSMISNFSAAYNTINISLGLILMSRVRYPPSSSSEISLCSSALIAGMVLGQIVGGLLGDWLGRHVAMSVVMSLQVAGAFWSGCVGLLFDPTQTYLTIYHMLAICRFLLGVGCGGVYPLAATITAESSSPHENRGKLVALTFSMQGVGYLAVSMTAYALVWILGEESDLAWRLLLGFGCVPGLGLILIRTLARKSTITTTEAPTENEQSSACVQSSEPKTAQVRLKPKSLFEQIKHEPNLLSKIMGTAGCWLMFDILFYGNTLFQPVVFAAAFGKSETILATVRDSMLISLIALPGYFVSVCMIGSQTPKRIQLQGFLAMALLYAVIGVKFSSLTANRFVLMGLYGLTFFFSNYGPNTTTFMMPAVTFCRPCRSTLNGICAASGKVGALLGSILFLPLANWLGDDKVMVVCSFVSLIAAAMTLFLEDSVEECYVKSVSSEAQLFPLDTPEDERPNLRKIGSMPSIFDQF